MDMFSFLLGYHFSWDICFNTLYDFIFFSWVIFKNWCIIALGLPWLLSCKESSCNAGDVGWEDPLEKGMATHSSVLAWKIPWTEEPGGLQVKGITQSQT